MEALDLRPYGIWHTLTPSTDTHILYTKMIRSVKYSKKADGNITSIVMNHVEYTVLQTLGSGTFGTTYKVRSSADGNEYAIKHIKGTTTDREFNKALKEAIIQILLADASKDQPHGPYVPYLYEIGRGENKHTFIRSELMYNTLHNLLGGAPVVNSYFAAQALLQISDILKFFGLKLNFNHRDFKGDNIMYVKDSDNNRFFKLIDFGFSCITWHGLRITGGGYFYDTDMCYSPYRDLAQMLYFLYKYIDLTPTFKQEIKNVLKAGVPCSMLNEPCTEIHEWANTYTYLERRNVAIPSATAAAVKKIMETYLKRLENIAGKPAPAVVEAKPKPVVVEAKPAPAVVEAKPKPAHYALKPCPSGKVVNPRTGRCIKQTRKATKSCPEGKVLNPKTGRCIKETRKAKPAEVAEPANICPQGKIRNPKTGRCVKDTHAAAIKLAEQLAAPGECPPGKIYNKKTGRCVAIDGYVGKQIAKALLEAK